MSQDGDGESKSGEGEDAAAGTGKKPSDGTPQPALDLPLTRKQVPPPVGDDVGDVAPPDADPNAPMTYPDDGPLSAGVRRFDTMIGLVEKGLLVALLAVVCLTAAAYTLLDHAFHIQLEWKAEVVHNGTFAIAMLGGVFATQQARHLSMDLISRRLSSRNRLYLKIVLAMFVAFIVVLMVRAGFHVITTEKTMAHHDLISSVAVAWLIPIAGALILLHTFLHTIIDVDYLRRGKTPPERMRSGH